MTTTSGATYNDINNWVQETASSTASFTSEVFEGIKTGAISAAQAQGELADAFAKDFQRYSESARTNAERAAATGNVGAERAFNRFSETFSSVAAERASLSAEAYNQRIASQATAAFSNLAKNVGPAADIINVSAGVAELISLGDFNKLGGALADISFSVAGGFLGAAVAGLIGAPVIAAGVLIGLFAVGGGFAGQWLWEQYGDGVTDFVNDWWNAARAWFPRSDPLTLDLRRRPGDPRHRP